jgi:hypothetical protein
MSVKGEKYASAAAKKKHEKTEGAKERKMEYGAKKTVKKVMKCRKCGKSDKMCKC